MWRNIGIAFLTLLLATFGSEFTSSAQASCWLKPEANVRSLPYDGDPENIIFQNHEYQQVVVMQDKGAWKFLLATTRDFQYPPLGWVHRSQLDDENDCRVVRNYTVSTPKEWVKRDQGR